MGACVGGDALLYIFLQDIQGGMLDPLSQASQCIPLLAREERHKGGCLKDFSNGGRIRSRQVVRR